MANPNGGNGKREKIPGALVPQPHGGALYQGGTWPNAGRMRKEFKEHARYLALKSFTDRIPTLEKIADGEVVNRMKIGDEETEVLISAPAADRIRALDTLAKVGLGDDTGARIMAAQGEIEDGDRRIRFSLIIGERTDD
jgi:hypothetical protein